MCPLLFNIVQLMSRYSYLILREIKVTRVKKENKVSEVLKEIKVMHLHMQTLLRNSLLLLKGLRETLAYKDLEDFKENKVFKVKLVLKENKVIKAL